ncbi:hypothetical protein [Neorhodopirellula pilleata]|uniref:Uncharacterized protein n=1 Tax=Neorhodopirellula pilleata TaxID=2714738 RepID=A0A5C5ZWD6_9BACT|nr:hypothetical protein [Neorhodopirellula pilleata]TWT91421.1 hypothetical protein Pla100_52710 [Neorhodopirellula pilleata]TWT91470.1 hypothetical protein Pla100_53200 [Neorhodopirellula pilleata]
MIQFTKPVGSSADIGFPVLTDGRRRSLIQLRSRAKIRFERMAEILAAMVADKNIGKELIKSATAVRERYADLQGIVELQFSEFRADRRGSFGPDDQRDNDDIAHEMKQLDSDLALVIDGRLADVRAFFDKGHSLPPISPLFARVPSERKARVK